MKRSEGRRMRGKGSVSLHKSGLHRAEISLGWKDGKRNRLTTYHPSREAAEAWLNDIAGERLPGVRRAPLRLGDWLDAWLRSEADRVSPKQLREDRRMVELMPAWLTAIDLPDLTHTHVERWTKSLTGGPRWKAINRNRLRAALNEAIRDRKVTENAAALARIPRQKRPKRVVIDAAEVRAILAACDEYVVPAKAGGKPTTVPRWRYHAAVAVAIGTGCRQGELLGLTWGDVRADRIVFDKRLRRDAGEYVVVGGTKTDDEDVRVVPLPAFARRALDEWKATQDRERRAAGDNVEPFDGSVPIFTTERGRHVNGSTLTHGFADRLAAAGLTHRTWYELRHATTDLLASGGAARTVTRDYVGHASVTTTDDHYTGSDWASLARAGELIEEAVGR